MSCQFQTSEQDNRDLAALKIDRLSSSSYHQVSRAGLKWFWDGRLTAMAALD